MLTTFSIIYWFILFFIYSIKYMYQLSIFQLFFFIILQYLYIFFILEINSKFYPYQLLSYLTDNYKKNTLWIWTKVDLIVIKPDHGIYPVKESGRGLHRSTWKNFKKNIWSFNISDEKIKKQFMWIYIGYICCK
jgi:hypothetical protein